MTDERVQAAIQNWAPRFTSQGVDHNDFFRTTARVDKWDGWCREWVATGNVHHALAWEADRKKRFISAGEAYVAAALCYHFGKFLFQDHHDEYMSAARKSVEDFASGLRLLDPTGERLEIQSNATRVIVIPKMAINPGAKRRARRLKDGS